MKLLILGATGMLGHKLVQRLSARFEVTGTLRATDAAALWAGHPIFAKARLIGGVDAGDFASVERALDAERPDAVVNCVGIVKQADAAKDPLPSISINALFPHLLARAARARFVRLVHFGTDCVFSGRKGGYTEADTPDAEDLYGRSKLLGEAGGQGALTLRSSIVGLELREKRGLIEWFLAQRGKTVGGYTRAIFSGLTTLAMADLVGDLLERHPDLDGVWQVSADAIAKRDLLELVGRTFDAGVTIQPDDAFHCDRSLDSTRFRARTGFVPAPWTDMIAQLRADAAIYGRQVQDNG